MPRTTEPTLQGMNATRRDTVRAIRALAAERGWLAADLLEIADMITHRRDRSAYLRSSAIPLRVWRTLPDYARSFVASGGL